jgi:DNA-binding SARP family transcriptional activator
MPITVGVLGAFSVSGQGGTVDLPGRPQRSLTAILALEGGRIVSVARPIDLLWPDTEPDDPLTPCSIRSRASGSDRPRCRGPR